MSRTILFKTTILVSMPDTIVAGIEKRVAVPGKIGPNAKKIGPGIMTIVCVTETIVVALEKTVALAPTMASVSPAIA
jgi:hypothetical protein